MFTEEENQSEQGAKFLIQAIRKAMKNGDLKGAIRRINRVDTIIADRAVERLTIGELLLTAAGVARCGGKKEKATELVMEILHGKGGMSIEILGRAKRLRARLLLDEGKLDEAEVLAGTADRYIVTGLIEEHVEHSAGRELRVNIPVKEKILDKGEFISFETYFLLAEIAILENNWEKAIWNINSASEKYNGDRLFPELEMWRGILEMARGRSFIEVIEPVLAQGDIPPVLVGRIEALLGEERREDSQINEYEYQRFRQISEKARQFPLVLVTENSETNDESITARYDETAPAINSGTLAALANDYQLEGQVIRMDLSRLSLMRLVEICDIEKVTGKIMLDWNENAIREGITESVLDGSVVCGKGIIYCQEGKFIDAELSFSSENSPNLPPDQKEQGRFCLQQMILITLGAGSKLLEEMQSGTQVACEIEHLPSVTGRIIREPDVAGRENTLQISNNLNFFLDVSKVLDERRGGIFSAEENEIDWDAEWGTPASKPVVSRTDEDPKPFVEARKLSPAETIIPFENRAQNFKSAHQSSDQFETPLKIEEDEDLLSLEDVLNVEEKFNEDIENNFAALESSKTSESDYTVPLNTAAQQLFQPSEVVEVIAPPWEQSSKVATDLIVSELDEKPEIFVEQTFELSLNSDEINALLKGESWVEVNNSIARLFSAKLGCGIRTSISRESEEFIVAAAGDSAEPIAETTAKLFESKFSIVERIEWILKADRQLEADEVGFTENVIEMGRLALLNLDHSEGKEVQSIGGVAIAGDEWLAKFMVPPQSLIMRKKINEVQVYARQDGISLPKAHILLGGETGTGKDVFARLIHEMSGRREMKFVRADMGAVGGGDQFIATLFGAVKGSYTGQAGDRRGLVEEAENGTLFLNEIGNLSLESQRALLDFMQEGCYTRLGDTKLRNANVRVILATNENINDATKFRQDVKFRCAPAVILPPLRDRREDIAALALSFAGTDVILREAAIKMLEYQAWFGNVRELSQVIKTAVARIGGEGEIKASVIEEVLQNLNEGQMSESLNFPVPYGMAYNEALEAYEKFLLDYSLTLTGNKKSNAAKLWGESPASITKKIKKWNLREDD